MKILALILPALVVGSVSIWSQQAAPAAEVWRPNIAEDNKAATLADTSSFMVGVLNSPVVQLSVGSNQRIWGAQAPQGCSLYFDQRLDIAGTSSGSFNEVVLLSRIDPFSIFVKPR